MATKLSLRRGDSATYRLQFNDGTNPIDITGYTVFFTVKRRNDYTSNDDLALIQKTVTSHTDAANGISDVVLSPVDTAIEVSIYKYDFQFKTPTGDISTVEIGEYEILDDVTKRTT